MDIGSKSGYPSSSLSNFAGHRFIFDGVECYSMVNLCLKPCQIVINNDI